MKITTVREEFELIKLFKTESNIILDFYADWCGPCKALSKIIESVSSEEFEDIALVKVNIEKFSSLASSYNVRSLPTLIFTAESPDTGERTVLKTKVGSLKKDDLIKLIGSVYEQ